MAKKNTAGDPGRIEAVLKSLEEGGTADPIARWLHGDGALGADDVEAGMVAVEVAKRLGRGDRLVELRDGTDIKAVRKAAAEAIHRLRSTGHVVAEQQRPGRSWSMGEEQAQYPPPQALLGLPQADGYFPYAVMSYGAEGGVMCIGLAGPGQGFKDDEHAHMGRSKARQTWDDIKRRFDWFEVPFHVGLHFAEAAFHSAGGALPGGWGHVLDNVPKETQDAARMLDPLRGQETSPDEDALHQVDELLYGDHSVVLMLDENVWMSGLTSAMDAMKSPLELDEHTRAERLMGVIDDLADRGLNDSNRTSWALALDVSAFLAKELGLDTMRKVARSTALAIREGRPGSKIPYVRALAERMMGPLTKQGATAEAAQP